MDVRTHVMTCVLTSNHMRKFIRKITRVSSHSYTITIPKQLIKKFGWRERQKIVISYGGRKEELKIKDWEPKNKKK